jgi:hypothetical protein
MHSLCTLSQRHASAGLQNQHSFHLRPRRLTAFGTLDAPGSLSPGDITAFAPPSRAVPDQHMTVKLGLLSSCATQYREEAFGALAWFSSVVTFTATLVHQSNHMS